MSTIKSNSPHSKTPDGSSAKNAEGSSPETSKAQSSQNNSTRKTGPVTRITLQIDVGFSNTLYLRGTGASLSWEKGLPLKNTKSDEWVWETSLPFTTCEFKAVLNDTEYEIGDNHLLTCGASILYTPKFN